MSAPPLAMPHWGLFTAYALAMAVGQVLFKLASNRLQQADTLVAKATDPALLGAFALYGGLSIAWIALLRGAPLGAAYPFVALSFVFTPILSALVFGDRLTPTYGIGLCLICAGVIVTQRAVHAA